MAGSQSIAGSWRGRYFYPASSEPHGFEAVFIDADGVLEGNILDDGQLGEADVAGRFHFPHVKFSKSYRSGLQPVRYEGRMSDDGKTLSGRWYLGVDGSGTWTAKRYEDGEELKLESEETHELQASGEKKQELAPV